MEIIRSIQNRIYEIRGERVMLDRDLARLYEIETKSLNLSVKRNIERFPSDFMFQLTKEEFESVRFQIESLEKGEVQQSWGGTRYLPYAFTEQGVAMLSGIISSGKAISMNIAIMRAFVAVRRIIFKETNVAAQIEEAKNRLSEHDTQLNNIYDAMENLLDEKAAQKKWDDRERIGFKR
ncbi:MAG: ORF6N domain-containing protein [Bacteroidetes bacterium]|nr:ORF6N domain-containing protein [Bacteroidota bacterium]